MSRDRATALQPGAWPQSKTLSPKKKKHGDFPPKCAISGETRYAEGQAAVNAESKPDSCQATLHPETFSYAENLSSLACQSDSSKASALSMKYKSQIELINSKKHHLNYLSSILNYLRRSN